MSDLSLVVTVAKKSPLCQHEKRVESPEEIVAAAFEVFTT
jgi:hypothetical protein